YTVTDSLGNVVESGSEQIEAGQPITVPVSGAVGSVTLTSTTAGTLTVSTDCADITTNPVGVSAAAACVDDGSASFDVTNDGGSPMDEQFYLVTDQVGNLLASGSFTLQAGESRSIAVTGGEGIVTFR